MTSTTISSIKVISTCGLGLLAGFTIASPLLITPTISSLSTASTAARLSGKQRTSSRTVSGCAALVALLMGTTYLASPSSARHPYLIYVGTLSLGASLASEVLVMNRVEGIRCAIEEEQVNGETVHEQFESLRRGGGIVAALFTVAFGVSVVGNYGDFY